MDIDQSQQQPQTQPGQVPPPFPQQPYYGAQPPAPQKKANWFARHKVLTALGAGIVVIAIGSAATGGGSSAGTAAQESSSSTNSTSGAKMGAVDKEASASTVSDSGPSTKFPMTDGDWRLDSLTVEEEDFLGDFTGRARITYIGDDSDGGDNSFTITVFKSDRDVATMSGFASDVQPGQTKTVDLLSTDDYVSGKKAYTFQNDW